MWLILAVAGHLFNAVAFAIDKTLLNTAFRRSATYAALIAILSCITLLLVPWMDVPPWGSLWILMIAFGGLNTCALWAFFEALKQGEATRVIPITGSLVPLFTLAGTSLFLAEQLTRSEWMGFLLLLVAILLLSSGRHHKTPVRALAFAAFAACLFALSFVIGKAAYNQLDFLPVFVISRNAAALIGVLLLVIDPQARGEIIRLLKRNHGKTEHASSPHTLRKTIFAQIAGGIGFVLVSAALAHGSAVLVNALQAVQFAFLVLIAWLGGKRLRTLLHEDTSPATITLKGLAILCTAAGLFLISVSPA